MADELNMRGSFFFFLEIGTGGAVFYLWACRGTRRETACQMSYFVRK